jgi:hypothetical protein
MARIFFIAQRKIFLMSFKSLLVSLLFLSLLSAKAAQGQGMSLHLNGNILLLTKYDEISDGSPFFVNDWRKAALLTFDGLVIENIMTRLDLLANEVHYMDSAGQALKCMNPVKSVIFKPSASDTGFTFVAQQSLDGNRTGWFQVLNQGKATLLKEVNKTLRETTGFGQGKPTKTIVNESSYWLWYQDKLTRIKKADDLSTTLQNEALNKWMAGRKKGGKAEDQMITAIAYFNAL